VAKEIRDLIRKMSTANPGWGSPRIVGELAKLGIHVAKATVEKYMVRSRRPPSPTWRAFLENHVKDLVSVDFFVVPTVKFRILFVFVVLAHARRRIVHFNITEHPTAQWTAQQISEAFPWEAAPRFLIRDRDRVYGPAFEDRVESMGVEEVLTAPRSPWQNPFAERVIGSIRRECLDHVVVLSERHLRRLLADYLEHYHRWRCHRSLSMDCPEPRPVQGPEDGHVVEVEEACGLYRHYERRAAWAAGGTDHRSPITFPAISTIARRHQRAFCRHRSHLHGARRGDRDALAPPTLVSEPRPTAFGTDNHFTNIKSNLDVVSASHAVAKAMRMGVIS
jgi:transposase InsO family protein